METILTGPVPTKACLETHARSALRDFMAGFEEAILLVPLHMIRTNSAKFLERGEQVLRERVRRRMDSDEMDLYEAELAMAGVDHAKAAIAEAFKNTRTQEFLAPTGFLAALRLHAVIALVDTLDVYGPWNLVKPIKLPPFEIKADNGSGGAETSTDEMSMKESAVSVN